MPQTLTEWWKQLDEETRKLAGKYNITYADTLIAPYTDVNA